MGDFPWMTECGTFIINGTERVVVTQLVRSPGAYVMEPKDREKQVFIANLMPARGSWLELEIDKKGRVFVRIDRKRKLPVTVLLRAMGYAEDEQILELFDNSLYIRNTIEADTEATKQRGGRADRAVQEAAPGRAAVDRQRAQASCTRCSSTPSATTSRASAATSSTRASASTRTSTPASSPTATSSSSIRELVDAAARASGSPRTGVFDNGEPIKDFALEAPVAPARADRAERLDEYEHFGNRRLRTVGELIQEAFRIGLYRMERVVRERLTTEDADTITPQTIINIRPVVAAQKEFFGSSQLSQFMDQTNSLSGLTHRRRLSRPRRGRSHARARAHRGARRPPDPLRAHVPDRDAGGSEHRPDRLAVLATRRSPSTASSPRPTARCDDGVVSNEIVCLDANQEETQVIAQANADARREERQAASATWSPAARGDGELVARPPPKDVDLMDVSPDQIWSVATALIPFLEHDDANRALMGSNMQRQAVPLLKTEAPLIGTGVERRAAIDTGDVVLAEAAGKVA